MIRYFCDECEKECGSERVEVSFSIKRGSRNIHPLLKNISASKMLCVECAKRAFGKTLDSEIQVIEDRRRAEIEDSSKPKTPDTDISMLGLSVRAYNCIKRNGIKTLKDLLQLTETDLMHIRNLGNKAKDELLDVIKTYGYLKE